MLMLIIIILIIVRTIMTMNMTMIMIMMIKQTDVLIISMMMLILTMYMRAPSLWEHLHVLGSSPPLKKTCVRHVVLDQRFPLIPERRPQANLRTPRCRLACTPDAAQ